MGDFQSDDKGLSTGPGLASLGLTLGQLAAYCQPSSQGARPAKVKGGGKTAKGEPGKDFESLAAEPVTRIVADSRLAGPGAVFVALKGEFVDGHKYVKAAIKAGALAALVSEGYRDPLVPEKRLVRVSDPLKALGNLAREVRVRAKPKVVAVTGSSGKTTVKEMLKSILSLDYDDEEILATRANFNNALGLPLTILSMSDKTRLVILEMGANHFGEIEYLAKIARPDVGLVTGTGFVHLEGFGDRAGVAKAKA
ncbi:MAG: UDP-N-acetylmuramoyl-tripeptide--D-alanyl-D-alanine ligase, partial [Deltaproteobacteria bacterium]|nr:UDP-N-acetylmuramoyl-tripeptide--D-alanyl-D-alanine ligase [Deltaproteobacteria bacterium]